MTMFRGKTFDESPAIDWKAIYAECAQHNEFVVEVRRYDPDKEISRQQMAYVHAVIFPALAEYVGCSQLMAEVMLKKKCGEQWFIKEVDKCEIILSKTMLSVNQTTKWLENIWEFMESIGCPVPPPDKNWRENKEQESCA